MAIGLFAAAAGSNVLVQLDDPTVWTDEGAAMPTPYFTTAQIDQGPAGGASRLRGVVQAVAIGGATSLTVTPIANGQDVTEQASTFALVTTDGAAQRVEHGCGSLATRHAVKVEVTSMVAAVTFGEADLLLVPRRSTENA